MSYRIVVNVDIEAPSLIEAYGKLVKAMGKITGPETDLDWLSSDEAYNPDGDLIDEQRLADVCAVYWAEEQRRRRTTDSIRRTTEQRRRKP